MVQAFDFSAWEVNLCSLRYTWSICWEVLSQKEAENVNSCRVWWYTPVVLAPWWLRQKAHHELKANLGYIINFRPA